MNMKKLNVALAILVTAVMAGNAQTNVTSDIVGYQTTSVPVGLSTAAFPLLNADLLKTSATTLSGTALGLSGQTNVGSQFVASEPYYLEVYSGTNKGDRFEINETATIAAANGTVVLDSTSVSNTFPVGSLGGNLNGATVAIRKHVTIEQVQAMSSSAWTFNSTASNADQIQFFDNAAQAYVSYYLRDATTWRQVGKTATANKTPVPAGTGVFISKKTSPYTLTATGAVRNNDFAMPYVVGLQLQGPGYPIDITPTSLGGTVTNGWTANTTASNADQIQVFDNAAQAYVSYYLRDATTWRQVGKTASVTGNTVATSGQGFFISRKASDAINVLVNPVTN